MRSIIVSIILASIFFIGCIYNIYYHLSKLADTKNVVIVTGKLKQKPEYYTTFRVNNNVSFQLRNYPQAKFYGEQVSDANGFVQSNDSGSIIQIGILKDDEKRLTTNPANFFERLLAFRRNDITPCQINTETEIFLSTKGYNEHHIWNMVPFSIVSLGICFVFVRMIVIKGRR